MSAHDDLLATLTAEGWTVRSDETHAEALSRLRLDRTDESRVRCQLVYGGTISSLHGTGTPWIEDAQRVVIWGADPEIEDSALSTGGKRMLFVYNSKGKCIRKLSWSSGSTVWVNPPYVDLTKTVVRNGHTGKQQRDTVSAELAEKNARAKEDRERLYRLLEDARDLLEMQGYQRTDVDVLTKKFVIDPEVLLSVLRSGVSE